MSKSYSQNLSSSDSLETSYFVSLNYGIQMSGIKDEDFVTSNYSPLLSIAVGKWINPYYALQLGYKGYYFNYIGDNLKHNYAFFYGEALVNLTTIVNSQMLGKKWSLLIHGGVGYFYNYFYDAPNFCGNIGIKNIYEISNNLSITLDISSIVGWDLYQGDDDILPGIAFGLTYYFMDSNETY